MVEPGLRGNEVVFLFEKLQRGVVEGPHSFFGENGGRGESEQCGGQEQSGDCVRT